MIEPVPRHCAAGARDGEEPLLIAELAAAMALRARRGFRSRPPRQSRARLAGLVAAESGCVVSTPVRRFVEGDLQVVAKIRAALRSAAAPPPPNISPMPKMSPSPPRMSSKPVKTVGSNPPVAADVKACMAEAVVDAALVGIGEHGVGFRRFLEFVFGRLVAGIAIRMVFASPACGRRS